MRDVYNHTRYAHALRSGAGYQDLLRQSRYHTSTKLQHGNIINARRPPSAETAGETPPYVQNTSRLRATPGGAQLSTKINYFILYFFLNFSTRPALSTIFCFFV